MNLKLKLDNMYNLSFYINKAENIDPALWITRAYSEDEAHCFMGHCGERNGQPRPVEAEWIYQLFKKYDLNVIDVNDGIDGMDKRFPYDTPDQRIIAALYWIRDAEMAKSKNMELINKLEPERDKYNKKIFKAVFKCHCGKEFIARIEHIKTGNTTSCGCNKIKYYELKRKSLTTHGKSGNPIYTTWWHMISRCTDPDNDEYKNYGGRGISVCKEWADSVTLFFDWSINNGWEKGLSIDRIDNDGNYEPSNCRWATNLVQSNNKRNNHNLTHNGVTKSITQWSLFLGGSRALVFDRLKRNWSVEKTITTPPNKSFQRFRCKQAVEQAREIVNKVGEVV